MIRIFPRHDHVSNQFQFLILSANCRTACREPTSMTLLHALRRPYITLRCISRRYASDTASQLTSKTPKKPATGKVIFHRNIETKLKLFCRHTFIVSSGHYSTRNKLLERPTTRCGTCRRRISGMALDGSSAKGVGR